MNTKTLAFTLLAIVAFIVGVWGITMLDSGWKTKVTKGNLGPFIIGQLKTEVIEQLSQTEHANAIIVNKETILLRDLNLRAKRLTESTSEWKQALSSDIWLFSPNVGHEFYRLEFNNNKLTIVTKRRYFW